jgi:hypothetical protein
VPLWIRLAAGCLIVLVGLTILAMAVLGARGRLRRNSAFGVHTSATMKSERAFEIAHRAAAVPLAAASAVAVLGGVTLLSGPAGALAWVVLAVAVVGGGALAGIGGLVGDRAAVAALNAGVADDPAPEPVAACAGSCAGCDLIEGCRAAVEAQK